MNIIIFSVSIGNGHDQVANSIKDEIVRQSPHSKVMVINTLRFISPLLDKVILKSYLNMLNISPKAWGKIYEKTDSDSSFIDINEITNIFITAKVKSIIESFPADAVICTHSLPAAMIGNLKAKRHITCPLISIITDFTVHYSWINQDTDYYIIPHEYFFTLMNKYQVEKPKILPFGIPIRNEFLTNFSRDDLLKTLNMKDLKTILVMGGGLGLGSIDEIVKEMDESLENVQIVAVAGRNKILEESLRSIKTKNNFLVYGYTDLIPQLMEVSDVIISKPGGVTTAEILSKHKPILIFDPLPGQEYENTEFLINSGVAFTTSYIHRIPLIIQNLLESDMRIKMIAKLCANFAKPYAATDSVKFILSLEA